MREQDEANIINYKHICYSKQRKLGDFSIIITHKKDDEDMWYKEKGYTIENIAGDGNCLYACLGRSRKLTGER
eukprot:5764346-Heterocapsa_arctica.AAC.1